MSQSEINAIIQDSVGFIWFGTNNGLYKYDGYNITGYQRIKEDSIGISDNYITSLVEDGKYIWVGTRNGLNRFNKYKNTFKHFFNDPEDSNSLETNNVPYIFKDSKNKIWIATGNLLSYDKKNNSFSRISLPNDNSNFSNTRYINSISEDHLGMLWICTSSGLFKFDPTSKIFLNFPFEAELNRNTDESEYLYFKEDSSHNYWIGSINDGLFYFDKTKNKLYHFKNNPSIKNTIPSNYISHIMIDIAGNRWLSTNNGISIIDKKTIIGENQRIFKSMYHSTNNKSSLSTNQIKICFQDSDNRIWVGGRFGDISIYDNYYHQFSHYKFTELGPEFKSNNMTAFEEDADGNLWIGTDGGGIYKWIRSEEKYIIYKNEINNKKSLASNKVLEIFRDSYNEIWIGMWEGGLNKYDKENDSFIRYRHSSTDTNTLSTNHIFTIDEDSGGNLLLGLWRHKLNLYNRNKDIIVRDPFPFTNLKNSFTMNFQSIHVDKNDNIWVGTELKGLFKINNKTKSFKQYFPESGNRFSISSSGINCIFEDSKNRIWIGSRNGLNLFDETQDRFTHYYLSDGLPSDYIQGILEDDQNNLWISSTKGLSKITIIENQDNLSLSIINFDHNDGLQGNLYNPWSYYKTSKGEMVFGGVNGMNIFDPSKISKNGKVPSIVITKLFIKNKMIMNNHVDSPLEKIITETEHLNLSYTESDISFEYAALNYTNPNKNKYAYKLLGFEKDWNYVDNSRRATYTNLDPGEYTFIVKGSNNDEVWNNSGKSINVVIQTPFWGTLWFKILVVIFAISSIIFFIKLRLRSVKKKNDLLTSMVEKKTRELSITNKELEVAKEELAGEKEELAITLKSIADAVITTNPKGEIILANHAAECLFNKNKDELIGLSLHRILFDNLDQLDEKTYSKFFVHHLSDYIPYKNEQIQIDLENKMAVTVTINSSILKDNINRITGLVFVLRDITEKIKIENQLAHSQKMESIGHLAAGISHEINTPMQFVGDNTSFLRESFNSLLSFIDTIKEIASESNGSKKGLVIEDINKIIESEDIDFLIQEVPVAIDQSQDGITRVSNIVTAMKDFSHPTKKEMAKNDINHGIEVTSTISKNEWKYIAELELNLDKKLPNVYCLHDEMNQVFLNMIVNAAHAIEEKNGNNSETMGKISISTTCNDDHAIIIIKDNGKGISKENLSKVFNPFFTTKAVGKGTGQGLSIAHDIITNKHNGLITVDSVLGEGAKFTIQLPIEAKAVA